MRRRWVAVIAAVVIAAGAVVAIAVSRPSHSHHGGVQQLVAPGPHLIIRTPSHPPSSRACRRLSHARFVQPIGGSVVGGVVEFAGRVGFLSCATNGVTYLERPELTAFRLAPDAVVVRRTTEGPRPIEGGYLPAYLADGSSAIADAGRTRFFRFIGPALGVTKLVELQHP